MLIGGEERCEMCGRFFYLNINKKQRKEYDRYLHSACYGHAEKIQDQLKSFNKFEREFIKSNYCPECQEMIFHSKLTEEDNHFFYDEELRGDVMRKFSDETEGMKAKDAVKSQAADQLSIQEKLLYLHEMELEDDFYVDEATGKFMEISNELVEG